MTIPYLLIFIRLLLAPVILYLAYYQENSAKLIAFLITFGLLTDIFDGIIARAKNQNSTQLRRMDSQTDMIFWISIGFAAWHLFSSLLLPYLPFIFGLFVTEGLCYGISFLKFKRETCTHAYLSKLFGLTMFVAFFSLFAFENASISLPIAIISGYVSHLDRMAISLILPTWACDIPSFYHANLIRKGKGFKKYKIFN